MKITIKNIGVHKLSQFETGNITVICGYNNTGKSYAVYSLFGFLTYWKSLGGIDFPSESIQQLYDEGTIDVDLNGYVNNAQKIIDKWCKEYSKSLSFVFSSKESLFKNSSFEVKFKPEGIKPLESYEKEIGSSGDSFFKISKGKERDVLTVTLLVDKNRLKISKQAAGRIVSDAIKEVIFNKVIPRPFIISSERTGAVLFRKDLDLYRNRLFEYIKQNEKIVPLDLLRHSVSDYPLPVKVNLDFIRQLESITKKESFIAKEHPEILRDIDLIIGGKYRVARDGGLHFIPDLNKKVKLTMEEGSSSIRSLLDLSFYLRHEAMTGDMLMVDEPELSLHPENQRRIARLFSRLVKIGIKVFITTHSDYIIKELNTLIMLNSGISDNKSIMKAYGYEEEELISHRDVKVYIAQEGLVKLSDLQRRTRCITLVPADIDSQLGIEAGSFDKTIDVMNRIQEEILFGGGGLDAQ